MKSPEEVAREWFANPPSAANWVDPLANLIRQARQEGREQAAKVAERIPRAGVPLCPYTSDKPGDPTWTHTEDDVCPVCRKTARDSIGFCTHEVGGSIAAAIRNLKD